MNEYIIYEAMNGVIIGIEAWYVKYGRNWAVGAAKFRSHNTKESPASQLLAKPYKASASTEIPHHNLVLGTFL